MFPILLGKVEELKAKCADLQRQIDEGGGGSTVNILKVKEVNDTLNKTYKEIKDADIAILYYTFEEDGVIFEAQAIFTYFATFADSSLALGAIGAWAGGNELLRYYIAGSENDYPFVD